MGGGGFGFFDCVWIVTFVKGLKQGVVGRVRLYRFF